MGCLCLSYFTEKHNPAPATTSTTLPAMDHADIGFAQVAGSHCLISMMSGMRWLLDIRDEWDEMVA